MDLEQLEHDVRDGRVGLDRLVGLIGSSQRLLQQANQQLAATQQQLAATQQQLTESQRRIAELERKLGGATAKLAEPFSMRAEEQRQQARGKQKLRKQKSGRRGRIATADKLKLAQRTEKVFPSGVAESDCKLSHTRPLWRLVNGQAVLIAYEIYRGPKNQYGKIPGTLGRSEFSLEFIVAIAYQVYVIGLSFDKVCLIMGFFQNLPLQKSQVDALLNQLARHWKGEFDALCTLLAHSAVVHADETSWSLRSVWAFLSEQVRVLFFGVHKDAETLAAILDPATFAGIVISDDAAVYANFTHAQKCWAHLLRKAIKLTLLAPDNTQFRELTDCLLEIYRAACKLQRDGRLSAAGRARKVGELDDRILALCGPLWAQELPKSEGVQDDYRLLVNELMRLMLAQQLFTFVTAAEVTSPSGEVAAVAGTNNEAERALRPVAAARKTGRTNKTLLGARRQTVLASVLESLRKQLPRFTLQSAIDEIHRWSQVGQSCFAAQLAKLELELPPPSPLDALLPLPGS